MVKKMQSDKKKSALTLPLTNRLRKVVSSLSNVLFLVAGILILSGCASGNKVPSESLVLLNIKANENINPDINQRPSPVELHVYFLRNINMFLEQDYYSLVEDPERILQQDLISKESIIIMPGEEERKIFEVGSGYSYVGIVASFREFEGNGWINTIKRPEKGMLSSVWPESLKVGRSGWLLYLDVNEREVRIRAR